MMKILVISKEAWRDEQNGGNVLSNLFEGFDAKFAQIYCNEREPNNNVCRSYLRISDREMVRSIVKRAYRAGARLEYAEPPHAAVGAPESFSGGKRWLGSLLPVMREAVWRLGRWDTKAIESFVRDFAPDVIFAPCYGNRYMHRLTLLARKAAGGVNVISYISDDHYSNRQLNPAPWFWINHLMLRRATRRVFRHYSLVYTMTDEQLEQCRRDFGANMKILRKAGTFDEARAKHAVGTPIRLVYAGGIYLNRWRTLAMIARAIGRINAEVRREVMRLDIYTSNQLTPKMTKALGVAGDACEVHGAVGIAELREVYASSDIALHCESFDLRNRLAVRLSFSTKIVDCLDSGCAVMAVADRRQAGLAYLRRNDAAICVSDPDGIEPALRRVADNPQMLVDMQHRAFALGRKNHLAGDIRRGLSDDFEQYSRKPTK